MLPDFVGFSGKVNRLSVTTFPLTTFSLTIILFVSLKNMLNWLKLPFIVNRTDKFPPRSPASLLLSFAHDSQLTSTGRVPRKN